MPEQKNKPRIDTQRLFEAETLALQSLIAGANPNPQDDISRTSQPAQGPIAKGSTDLIYQLIDCIKAI